MGRSMKLGLKLTLGFFYKFNLIYNWDTTFSLPLLPLHLYVFLSIRITPGSFSFILPIGQLCCMHTCAGVHTGGVSGLGLRVHSLEC